MEHLKETFLFRLCLGLFALALAALLGSLVGSFFSDHTFFDGWNSALPSAMGWGGRYLLCRCCGWGLCA